MFFPVSKIAFFLITPSNLFILLALLGVLATFAPWGWGLALGRGLAIAGLAGLIVGGLLPLPVWILLPLEDRFPAFVDDGRPVDGVIVLGGGLMTGISAERDQLTVNDAGERQIALGDLARRYPQARLLFSGGGGGLAEAALSEAGTIERFAGTLGVPRDRLILEERSRNTHENAAFSAQMIHPKPGERWLLVTSAWHMPRAVGCFRKAGIPVTAYPVDYRTAGPRDLRRLNGFASDGLIELDIGVKEWIGLVVYRIVGYTDDWMPAP